MQTISYHRPSTIAEAVELLRNSAEGKFLAGGQTLIPTLKQRLASPKDVIDLTHLKELKGITIKANIVTIGAAVRHAEVAAHPGIAAALPALANLAHGIGDPHVRNMGTIGGSLANNDPAADFPAAALALGAMIRTNERSLSADDFFTGMFETALNADEIVTTVDFPVPFKAAYIKIPNPASRYAIVGAFVALFPKKDVRVAITGAAPSVFRAKGIEQALTKDFISSAVNDFSLRGVQFNNDIHASSEYRAHLTVHAVRSAVEQLSL